MDTTGQYTEMCKEARKIQAQLPELAGATAWSLGSIKFIIHEDVIYYLAPSEWLHLTTNKNFIWLPQQDDLQKMSELDWQSFDRKCLAVHAPTKEQAGLRVVMKELHQKTWSEEMMIWQTI